MRRITIVSGVALVVLAFAAATRVSDTREGLIAEVITLLGGLGGVGLLIYGLTARRRASQEPGFHGPTRAASRPDLPGERGDKTRSPRDVLLGVGGVVLASILLGGLAWSGDALWLGLGFVLLLPMLAGSVYLCVRFLRATP